MSNPNLSKKFREVNKKTHVMKAIKEVAAIRKIETFYTNLLFEKRIWDTIDKSSRGDWMVA